MIISPSHRTSTCQVKKELKAAVKAYVLRQTALDNVLAEAMQRRDFDWDMDMRRMMDAVKVMETVSDTILEIYLQVGRKEQGGGFPVGQKGCKQARGVASRPC